MSFRLLFILVEGNDDLEFFSRIIKPIFKGKYDHIHITDYKKDMGKEDVVNLFRSIKAMDTDYIFVGDINAHPCATAKKQRLKHTYKNIDENKIVVVKKEIESWYLAGLDKKSSKNLRLRYLENTDNVIKEQFNSMIPKKFGSRVDFMREILKFFSIGTAKQKNESFKYFIEKYDC